MNINEGVDDGQTNGQMMTMTNGQLTDDRTKPDERTRPNDGRIDNDEIEPDPLKTKAGRRPVKARNW